MVDLPAMLDLVVAAPEGRTHLIDAGYRLCSPSAQDPAGTRLWHDGAGLAGWAVWQQPWAALDVELRPDRADALLDGVLTWGESRFRAMAAERGRPLDYAVEVHDHDAGRAAALAHRGFARDERHLLHLTAPLVAQPGTPPPDGYTVRSVGTPDRTGTVDVARDIGYAVAAQRAAFGSANMTAGWRERIRALLPRYRPELDLIATGPDGEPAGFCLGWLHPAGGQIEPIGVHPRHVRRGVGRAMLSYALSTMAGLGAAVAHVEVYADNAPAIAAYESVGYRLSHRVLRYVKTY